MSVSSDVEMGSGLSSSAALECASLGAIASATGARIDLVRRARIAQRAENDYVGAPTDGSAWVTDSTCELRQIRGNDWGEAPVFSRSGNRNDIYPQTRGDWVGMRVQREL